MGEARPVRDIYSTGEGVAPVATGRGRHEMGSVGGGGGEEA